MNALNKKSHVLIFYNSNNGGQPPEDTADLLWYFTSASSCMRPSISIFHGRMNYECMQRESFLICTFGNRSHRGDNNMQLTTDFTLPFFFFPLFSMICTWFLPANWFSLSLWGMMDIHGWKQSSWFKVSVRCSKQGFLTIYSRQWQSIHTEPLKHDKNRNRIKHQCPIIFQGQPKQALHCFSEVGCHEQDWTNCHEENSGLICCYIWRNL